MATIEDRLVTLRAQLEEAEHAVAGLAENVPEEVRAAAKATHAAAQKALAAAHLEAKQVAEKVEREMREAEAAAKVAETAVEKEVEKVLSLQESNQSASTQNVRGTEDLTPQQHAARRNPPSAERPFRSAGL